MDFEQTPFHPLGRDTGWWREKAGNNVNWVQRVSVAGLRVRHSELVGGAVTEQVWGAGRFWTNLLGRAERAH